MVSSYEIQISEVDAEDLIQVVSRIGKAKVVPSVCPPPRNSAYQSKTTGITVWSRCYIRKVISRRQQRRHFASVAEDAIEETGNILRAESNSPHGNLSDEIEIYSEIVIMECLKCYTHIRRAPPFEENVTNCQ